jgi:ABC-type multidrug transport system ATPase subunit
MALARPEDYAVMIDKVRKVYPNKKVAVDKISLGIKQGEVFGLLGVNGAGKTTTFKMLTGDEMSNQGRAFVHGHNLDYEQDQANQFIGYCP